MAELKVQGSALDCYHSYLLFDNRVLERRLPFYDSIKKLLKTFNERQTLPHMYKTSLKTEAVVFITLTMIYSSNLT